MPSGEQVALEPCLAVMLAENLYDASIVRCDILVVWRYGPLVIALCHLKDSCELIRCQLIWTEDAEDVRVAPYHFGQVFPDLLHTAHVQATTLEILTLLAFNRELVNVWQIKRTAQGTTYRMWIATHATVASRTLLQDFCCGATLFIEEFCDMVRAQPLLQQLQMLRICLGISNRHLMGTE